MSLPLVYHNVRFTCSERENMTTRMHTHAHAVYANVRLGGFVPLPQQLRPRALELLSCWRMARPSGYLRMLMFTYTSTLSCTPLQFTCHCLLLLF